MEFKASLYEMKCYLTIQFEILRQQTQEDIFAHKTLLNSGIMQS